jgi:hypothetical protein
MSKMDYSVHHYVYGYVAEFLIIVPSSFRKIQAYKCIFMGNGFWSMSRRKKKSAVGKINGLTQVTPATLAYAVAQVRCILLSCTGSQLKLCCRHVLLSLPARNGESKTGNLFFKIFMTQSWSFLKTKKTSGWWIL